MGRWLNTHKWRIHQTLKRGGHNNHLGRRSPWWRGRQEGAGGGASCTTTTCSQAEVLIFSTTRLHNNNMQPGGGAHQQAHQQSWLTHWRCHHSWVYLSRSWPRRSLNWLTARRGFVTTLEEGMFGSSCKGESESPPSSSVVFLFCDFTI